MKDTPQKKKRPRGEEGGEHEQTTKAEEGFGGKVGKRKRALNKRGAGPYPSFCCMSLPSSRLTGTPAHDGVKLIEEEEAGGGL